MKTATLTFRTPFVFAPAEKPARRTRMTVQPAAPATGRFARLERESALGGGPEAVVFGLLALTGVAWPTYEAIRFIAGF